MEDPTPEAGIAVLLALPPLLADVVQDIIERDRSMRIAGRLDATSELTLERTVAAAREARANVVLLGVRRARVASFCEALFDDQPRIKVIAIEEDGRAGTTTELSPRVLPLGDLWPERLICAIREMAARRWLEAWPA